jgi:hypothetical protein
LAKLLLRGFSKTKREGTGIAGVCSLEPGAVELCSTVKDQHKGLRGYMEKFIE